MKAAKLLWSISLISIGICTIIIAGAKLLSIDLPDFITRTIGLIDLAALPILGYATVKGMKNRRQ